MPEVEGGQTFERVLMDAGVFIGALLRGDPRHAAAALVAGVMSVYTYDPDDWEQFASDGLRIVGPPSTIIRISQRTSQT